VSFEGPPRATRTTARPLRAGAEQQPDDQWPEEVGQQHVRPHEPFSMCQPSRISCTGRRMMRLPIHSNARAKSSQYVPARRYSSAESMRPNLTRKYAKGRCRRSARSSRSCVRSQLPDPRRVDAIQQQEVVDPRDSDLLMNHTLKVIIRRCVFTGPPPARRRRQSSSAVSGCPSLEPSR
jgi:hypothetical protein